MRGIYVGVIWGAKIWGSSGREGDCDGYLVSEYRERVVCGGNEGYNKGVGIVELLGDKAGGVVGGRVEEHKGKVVF